MIPRRARAPHPGRVLKEKYLDPINLAVNRLGLHLCISPQTILEIIKERRGIRPVLALRLARYFGTPAKYWMDLGVAYELDKAEEEMGEQVSAEVRPRASCAYYHDAEKTQVIESFVDPDFHPAGLEADFQDHDLYEDAAMAILSGGADCTVIVRDADGSPVDSLHALQGGPAEFPVPNPKPNFKPQHIDRLLGNVTDYPELEPVEFPVPNPKRRGRPRKVQQP